MTIIVKKPTDCSFTELKAFKQLILLGNEVEGTGLDRRIKAAGCLAFQYTDNNKLIGICALKQPTAAYRNKVFKRAESPNSAGDFPIELGWLFILKDYRGKGLSRPLAEETLKCADKNNVFATTRVDNCPMCRTNSRLGFKRCGNPYRTTRDGHSYFLSLFVRHFQKNTE